MNGVNKLILVYLQVLKGIFIPSCKFPNNFLIQCNEIPLQPLVSHCGAQELHQLKARETYSFLTVICKSVVRAHFLNNKNLALALKRQFLFAAWLTSHPDQHGSDQEAWSLLRGGKHRQVHSKSTLFTLSANNRVHTCPLKSALRSIVYSQRATGKYVMQLSNNCFWILMNDLITFI